MDDPATTLPRLYEALEAGIAQGLHPGAQVFVSQQGKVLGDFALGQARPGVPMRRDTIMLWLSATKPTAAIAIAQLLERGSLDLDDRVALTIPEFATRGKEPITIRHILTHTCGFRFADTGWPEASWEQSISRLCDAPLERNWVVGQTAGYHANSSWFILGEIIRRLDGRAFEQYVRDEIFLPLGMQDCWVGMPPQQYRAYGDRLALLMQTDKSPPRVLPPWDREAAYTHCRPSANGCGPARELGRFYQMLHNGGQLDGVQLLRQETVDLFTRRQRVGSYDLSFRHIVDFGLGFIVNSARYGADTVPYGFGPAASEETFGHNGFQSTIAFADPQKKRVVVIIPSGAPGDAAHEKRLRADLHALDLDVH